MCNTFPISVVIATLGGESLRGTISNLNSGKKIPSEILICIPAEDAFRVESLVSGNVKIVKTNCRGQVAQRAEGFAHASNPYVMQLDDDILLQEEDIEKLFNALISLGPGNVIAPIYLELETGKCVHSFQQGLSAFIMNIYAYIICGTQWGKKRMGRISPIGVGYSVDIRFCGSDPIKTEWLPGGCILYHLEDLIMENFFPYTGKAYSEDIIHSFLRRNKNQKHWVIPVAFCRMTLAQRMINISEAIAEAKARVYVVKLINGQKWRLLLFCFIDYSKRVPAVLYSKAKLLFRRK